jgi:sugar lactone lactonase YvrE
MWYATRMRVPLVLAGAMVLVAALVAAHPPVVEPPTPFASGLAGPEGLAFGKDGTLYVGTADGDVRRVLPDGTHELLASTGDRLAGISVLKDGRILACGFNAGRVWAIDPATGFTSVYATVDSPNFVVQTKRGQVLVSSSFTGSIVDITGGGSTVVAGGFVFPNGLALRKKYLYVAQTANNDVVRLPFTSRTTLGAPEPYAGGMAFADGIAFDRPGNLFVVGFDTLWVVDVKTGAVTVASTDPLLEWPSNIAFGRTNPYGKGVMFLANFGPALGDGTTIVRVPTNHRGAKLVR